MCAAMRVWLGICMLSASMLAEADAVLLRSQWERPRSAEWIVKLEQLNELVLDLNDDPDLRMYVRFPVGESGIVWANELKNWLVALGVEPERVVLEPGSDSRDRIYLKNGPGEK